MYAISLGVPEDSCTIKALNTNFKLHEGYIQEVSIVGYPDKVEWKHNEEGLTIYMPENFNADYAVVFKIKSM